MLSLSYVFLCVSLSAVEEVEVGCFSQCDKVSGFFRGEVFGVDDVVYGGEKGLKLVVSGWCGGEVQKVSLFVYSYIIRWFGWFVNLFLITIAYGSYKVPLSLYVLLCVLMCFFMQLTSHKQVNHCNQWHNLLHKHQPHSCGL